MKDGSSRTKKRWGPQSGMQIDPYKTYRALMETTKGIIELELSPQHAPKALEDSVFLAREGFYDGVSFRREISDFVIRGAIRRAQVGAVLAMRLKNGKHTVFGKVVKGQEVVDAIREGDQMDRVRGGGLRI